MLAAMMTLKTKTEFRTRHDCGLKTLVPQLLHTDLPTFKEVVGEKSFDELSPEDYETVRYACADSDFALQLYYLINNWFDKYMPKHRWIIENIESPAAIFVGLMKYNGVAVNKGLMYKKQFDADETIGTLHSKIKKHIGEGVEIGANASTESFKRYLYDELKLPVLKTTEKMRLPPIKKALSF